MIDYILAYDKQKKLIYAGHSQGGSMIMVLLCERPEYNKKVSSVHLIAGAVMVTDTTPLYLIPFLKFINELQVFIGFIFCVRHYCFVRFLIIFSFRFWLKSLSLSNG